MTDAFRSICTPTFDAADININMIMHIMIRNLFFSLPIYDCFINIAIILQNARTVISPTGVYTPRSKSEAVNIYSPP